MGVDCDNMAKVHFRGRKVEKNIRAAEGGETTEVCECQEISRPFPGPTKADYDLNSKYKQFEVKSRIMRTGSRASEPPPPRNDGTGRERIRIPPCVDTLTTRGAILDVCI